VLHVIHGHGGGTEHHARALIDASRAACRHYLAIAVGDAWQVEEHLDDGGMRRFTLHRGANESWPEFVGAIGATFRIDLLHLHNISGCRDGIVEALAALGLPYGYTVHDLNFACPTILFLGADGNYCHEQTDPAVCGACLSAQPAFAHVDIVDWRARHRALLARAAFLVAPSRWAAAALERYYPEHAVKVIAHAAPGVWARQTGEAGTAGKAPDRSRPLCLPDDGVPTVAVLGAVGPDKGARRLERMAALAREAGLRVRFALIGYLDVEHGPWQSEDAVLTIHGRYDPAELPKLLAHYRVRLVAFPSAGPETFSFTLSEAWAAGMPVVVPPFGALAERVAGSGGGWLWTEAEWRDDASMLARITELVAPENAAALAAAGARARAIPQATLSEMATRTLEMYDAASAAALSRAKPLDRARLRDALGYTPWVPPAVAAPASAPASAAVPATTPESAEPDGFAMPGVRAATLGVALRETLPGRVLRRLVPARVRQAIKARLR
jgi:glycosyltransferase involved in cell wall biosynthesis